MYTVTYNVAPGTDVTVHDILQLNYDGEIVHLVASNGLTVYDVRKDKIVKVVKQNDRTN